MKVLNWNLLTFGLPSFSLIISLKILLTSYLDESIILMNLINGFESNGVNKLGFFFVLDNKLKW